jgi:hypothetical protein
MMGEVCLDDEKNDIERHETAVGASFGGRRGVVPVHSDLEIASKRPNGYTDGQNRGSSGECRLKRLDILPVRQRRMLVGMSAAIVLASGTAMAALPEQFLELEKITADYGIVIEVEAILPTDRDQEGPMAMCRMQARILEVRRAKATLPNDRPIEIQIACRPHAKEPGPMQIWMNLRNGVFHAAVWGGLSEAEHPELVPADLTPPSTRSPPILASDVTPGPPSPGAGRAVTRNSLNGNYRGLLPRRGVLAGGGGFVSKTWRVVVDFEASMLTAARSDKTGQLIAGPLDASTAIELSPSKLAEIETLSRHVLENDTTPQTVFSADSVGVLVIVDGTRAYELMPAGPITQGPAVALHRMLYEHAWPDD